MNFKLLYTKIVSLITSQLRSGELKNKIAQGGALVSMGNGLDHLLRFIRNMILTRLLLPDVLGVMAIVLATQAAFDSFADIGLKQVIIQNKNGEEKDFLNGAWLFSIVRALLLYTIAFIFTPTIAQFYENPDLNQLIRIAFLSVILKGTLSPMLYVAIKRFRFHKLLIVQNGGGILGVITTVILVYMFQNIWALVIGFTMESVYMFILSYIVCPFLPSHKFKKESINAILKFALGMLGLPILTFIFLRADVFVLGKMIDKSNLGLYIMAVTLASTSMQFFTTLISQVGMPAFSKIQDDMNKINEGLYKITQIITVIFFPAWMFVIFYGEDILNVVYGAKYAQVAIPFAIIFCTGLLRLISQPIATIYFALGKPELHRLFVGIRAILICLIIYPAIKYFGLIGAASATIISMLISFIVQIVKLRKITYYSLMKYTNIILKSLAFASLFILLWFILLKHIQFNPFVNIIVGLSGYILLYIIATLVYFIRKKRTMPM